MGKCLSLALLALVFFLSLHGSLWAQSQYIGYVYPAGGRQGTTFPILLGGQSLANASALVVSGEGVSVRLVDHYRRINNEELGLLRQQLDELKKKETTLSDEMAARINSMEVPAQIGPASQADSTPALICPVCGTANPIDAAFCVKCSVKLEKPKEQPTAGQKEPKSTAPKSANELAKEKLIQRIQRRFDADERSPAVASQSELVFAEVTIAPNAEPGRREIRVITRRGISNPLPFFVGQLPEVARAPMKTMRIPVLGKEHLAQRKRPIEEEEMRIPMPCTMNGQIAAGEVNRYRFKASKGQRLVISAKARELNPYVADAVPGWFQAVLKLYDAKGREVAYNDDFRSNPDPVIYFQVPEDGEYLLAINEALFRGRESFVYRISLGELPFVTSHFPLGGQAGTPLKSEFEGWNLEKTAAPLPNDLKPGIHLITACNGSTDPKGSKDPNVPKGELRSNSVPFAVDTLPEVSHDKSTKAQALTLPVIVNGRIENPGQWDLFKVEAKAGETLVAEVEARRLGSPLDSLLKITNAKGKVIALNDDHFDAASGLNTDHADSYLMVKLPADGTYFIHLGDTRRHGGKEFAYRLRVSQPRPDFQLRLVPSRIVMAAKGSNVLTVFAIRKDGYEGPIKLSFKDLPQGFQTPGATLAAKEESVKLPLRTSPTATDKPINLTAVGTATIDGKELIHEAVPTEDKMQAFLWRHLLPADTLPVVVFDPSQQAAADERVRPLIRDEDRPKEVKRTATRSSVEGYLKTVEGLYQEWFLTDEFANRESAKTEATVIQ